MKFRSTIVRARTALATALAALAVGALLSLGSARPAAADVANAGFESGDLTGWTTTGNVEVLQGDAFAPAFAAPEGNYFALLSSGPGNTGGGDSGVNRDGGFGNEWDVATMSQTFDVAVDSTLAVRIAFGSSEATLPGSPRDDIFEVRIDDTDWVQGSVSGYDNSPWPDFGTPDGLDYTVTSLGAANGSRFADGMSAVTTVFVDLTAGSHTIDFFVGDEADNVYDSGLIVDGLTLTPLITLDPPSDTLTAGEGRTVTATVTDSQGGLLQGTAVAFDVTAGPGAGNTGTCAPNADCTTDANGQVSFTYTSEDAGTDTVQACYIDAADVTHCATATAEWLAAPAEPTPSPSEPEDTSPSTQGAFPPQDSTPADLPTAGGAPAGGVSGILWAVLAGGALAATSGLGLWLARR